MKNNNIFRNFIDNILIITLLLCSSLFTSCLNLLSDGQDTPERENSSYVILEGTINPQNIENNSRYAYPTITEIPNGSSYYYKAIATNGTNTATGEGSFSSWADAKYSLKVPYGTWTNIIVEIYKESTLKNIIYEGTKTINLVVNETSPATVGEEVIVKPQHITEHSGNINLTFYNNTNITTLYAKLIYTGIDITAPAAISITNNSSASFVMNNVPTGSYNVTINFYKQSDCSDIPCYSCFESINVYPDLTTDLWGGNNDTAPHLQAQEDGSVHFVLTQNLLDKFVHTTFYVGTSTDGTGNGSYFNPFSNLTDAINLCTSDSDIYRIILTDDIQITEDITITKNITISSLGEDSKKTISGGSTLRTFSLSTKPITFNNLILNNILIKVMNMTSINNCTINNGTNYSIQVDTGSLLLSGECSFSGNIYSNNLTINLTGNVYPPDTDTDGIVATILTDKTTVSTIFSGGNTSQNINSIHYFNILPTTYTATTPARQFIDFSNSSNLNNYELYVVRYVADSSPTTNGLGAAGALYRDGGKGTKLKPYLDVFDAVDSLDGNVNTGASGSTENALEGYKYLIYVAGTVGVNENNPNRNLVFGKTGVKASYYIRGYNADNPYKTDTIKRENGGNYISKGDLFTITGKGIDVHVDNLRFIDDIPSGNFSGSYGHGFVVNSGTAPDVNSLELNNVIITAHQVAVEGSAIYAEENTKLKLNNVTIDNCQGNGYAIKYAGSENIEISGKINISNNKDVTGNKDANIWFGNSTAKIKITDTLDTASRIGISNRIPTRANPKIVFTDGFSTNTPSGTEPTTIFSSDEGYIICQDNNEVAVTGITYGSIKPKIKDDIVLVANGTAFINGQQNKVEIVPKIDGMKIEDDKLSDWTFELYFYGNKIELGNQNSGLPYSSGNTLSFPDGTPAEGLSVFAKVKYNGAYYSTDVKLTDDNIVNKPEDYEPVLGDVIYVSNQEGWDKIVNWVNVGKSLVGVDVIITNDFTLSNARTVGMSGKKFEGEIYGQQHTITLASVDTSYSALVFNYDNSLGYIDGITIAGPESGFYFNTADQDKYYGIVRILTSGYVSNCINRCSVSSSSSQGSLSGIVGYCVGQSDKNIFNCKNFGNFKNTTSGDSSNPYYVGGILAYSNNCKITIMNCINEGNLTGYIVGGIAGSNQGGEEINSCINKGNVTGQNSGGIAGYGSGKITKCKNTGTIMTETAAVSNVGGIIGYVISNITIDNCLNDGNVGWNSTENKNFYTGGIVGNLSATDGSSHNIKYNCNLMEPDNSVINNSIKWFSGVIGRLYTISGSPTINIANNIYYKSTKTYYGTGNTDQNEDESKYFAFNNENINNALEKLKDASNSDRDVWTITYKNGKPQLDLNIFIEE